MDVVEPITLGDYLREIGNRADLVDIDATVATLAKKVDESLIPRVAVTLSETSNRIVIAEVGDCQIQLPLHRFNSPGTQPQPAALVVGDHVVGPQSLFFQGVKYEAGQRLLKKRVASLNFCGI